MAEIFISYAREDVEAARRLAAELEERGWSVFWDRRIPAGQRFADVIASELSAASCVIVLWSTAGNASDWVLDEAAEALKRNILVPAHIEPIEPPMGFRRIHAANLIGWRREGAHEGFERLLKDISQYVLASPRASLPREAEHVPSQAEAEAEESATSHAHAAKVEVARPIAPVALKWRQLTIRLAILTVAAGLGWLILNYGPSGRVEPASEAGQRQPGSVHINPGDDQFYVWVPPGEFQMGCWEGYRECMNDEKPWHKVRITRGFWLSQTEVTQAAYEKVMRENPSDFKGSLHPVENVTWNQARKYCEAVGGRLPTEAEWEYAARAGSRGDRHGTLDAIAWFERNSGGQTHPVKQKQPNSWGLYDMLGNVREWVADWYQGNYYQGLSSPAIDPKGPSSGTDRVLRGGSCYINARVVRASFRDRYGPEVRNDDVGFRCAREAIP